MTTAAMQTAIAEAVKRNLSFYESKFGPKSLDTPIFEGGRETFKDAIAQRTYGSGDEDCFSDEPLSSLTPEELDALTVTEGLVSEARRLREFAEEGRGWRSTLDIEI